MSTDTVARPTNEEIRRESLQLLNAAAIIQTSTVANPINRATAKQGIAICRDKCALVLKMLNDQGSDSDELDR